MARVGTAGVREGGEVAKAGVVVVVARVLVAMWVASVATGAVAVWVVVKIGTLAADHCAQRASLGTSSATAGVDEWTSSRRRSLSGRGSARKRMSRWLRRLCRDRTRLASL